MTDNVHGLWIPELIYIIYIIYRFYKSLFAYFINFFCIKFQSLRINGWIARTLI